MLAFYLIMLARRKIFQRSKDWYGIRNKTFMPCMVYTCSVFYLEDELKTGSAEEAVRSADAVMFNLRNMTDLHKHNIEDLNRWRLKNGQKFIFYNVEPESYMSILGINFGIWEGFFNWTMSHRTESDIYRPYGVFAERPYEVPLPNLTNYRNKSVLWLVSRCNTLSARESYVGELIRNGVNVDIYGECVDKKCDKQNCDKGIYENYRFYLSFENSICEDYVTEKLFKILRKNVIPIVLGGADYSQYAPIHSYININDFASPAHLARYIKHLEKDKRKYQSYFLWKKRYTIRSVLPNMGWCQLCAMLHNETAMSATTIYQDIFQWLMTKKVDGIRKQICKSKEKLSWSQFGNHTAFNSATCSCNLN